jgi:hypothetical protein
MMERANRATGEPFWGCSRYPACHGTRPMAAEAASRPSGSPGPAGDRRRRRTRVGLSFGGRPRGVADDVELIVARLVGRTLSPLEGCFVQIGALVLAAIVIWALFASGVVTAVADGIGHFMTSQMRFGPSPSP